MFRKVISVLFKNREKLLLGWFIMVPLAYLVPKKKSLVLFIGKDKGKFFDNVKYLYLYLHRVKKTGVSYYFFTTDKSVYRILKRNRLPVVFHPSLLSFYVLLRAHIIVTSDTSWRSHYKYYFLFRAKKIQLWHGLPLKRIKLSVPREAVVDNSLSGRLHNIIRGKHRINDVFVSTSGYYTQNAFSIAFRARHFLESGYPRNDIFFNSEPDKYDLLGADERTISRISELRNSGHKIILYAPTYRDTGGDPVSEQALDLGKLLEFAEEYKLGFVFKFHGYTNIAGKLKVRDRILEYDNSKDVQPILKAVDILITDYSSIYMDYLLLDRPIIFFPYDYDKYTQKDRELLFDYDEMTPGPKCYTQQELQETLIDYVAGHKDDFSAKREELKNLAFKHKDGKASERIWNFIQERYIDETGHSSVESLKV